MIVKLIVFIQGNDFADLGASHISQQGDQAVRFQPPATN